MQMPTHTTRWAFLAAFAAFLALPRNGSAQFVTYVNDPLTSPPTSGAAPGVTAGSAGGSFGPSGWTTTGDTDTVWFSIPASLPRGRVEVDISGLSTTGSLIGQEHDLIGLYGPTENPEPVRYNPWYRNNEFKFLVRIFGAMNVCSGCQAVGASKLELALCPSGDPRGYVDACPAACVAAGYDFWQAYLGRGRDDGVPWDAATTYHFVIAWEPGRATYTRGGAEGMSELTYPGTYAPRQLRVRLGPPSSERGPDTAMPRGLLFRNLRVSAEPGAPTPSCTATMPPPDAGTTSDAGVVPGCTHSDQISARALEPVAARGQEQTFRTTFSHTLGAAAFRVAQFWIGDRVDPAVANVSGGYEAGMLYLGSAACRPGDPSMLRGTHGSLDCARTTVTQTGNDLTIAWVLQFDPVSFGGTHSFFVDAKGPAGPGEPRLCWTPIGTYTVESTPRTDAGAGFDAGPPAGDAGSSRDSGRDTGRDARGGGPIQGTCACRTPGGSSPRTRWSAWALAAAAFAMRAARRRVRDRDRVSVDGD